MKFILAILCCIALQQGFAHDGGHGHAHHHHEGHQHGHEEHENPNEYYDEVKFRYSKQANADEKPSDVDEMLVDKIHDAQKNEDIHHDKQHAHEESNPEDDHAPSESEHATKEEKKDTHSSEGAHHDGHSHSHGHSHEHAEKHSHSHGHTHDHDHTEKPADKKNLKKEPVYWLEPLLATAMISAAPFLILFVVPLTSNSPESRPFLKVLLSFASGGLLGDAFLHLIPHAISPHNHAEDHSHSHSHSHGHTHGDKGHDHTGDMIVGLWVLGGIIAFLMVEKFVRFVKGGHGHSHGHSHDATDVKDDSKSKGDGKKESEEAKKEESSDDETGKEKEVAVVESEGKDIKVAAYLNLAADCTHNFTDGLAIGASFLISRNVGLITTLTIFLHEIPHEIGDFAILIQSGCTKRKAMLLQLVTAIGAFAGCICGLLAEGLGTAASAWILPFTAGGFIYIATVSVIPELLEESKLVQSIKEILALLVGVFLMVVIALTE